MKKYRFLQGIAAVFLALSLSGCGGMDTAETETEEAASLAPEAGGISIAETPSINDIGLRDKKLLYANDNEESVVTMYLTVRRGNEAEGTNHSWEEINTYSVYDYTEWGVDRYQVEAILQVGDETGPLPGEFGYGETVPNATVQIRGQTSSRNAQKNYKVRIKDNKGYWNDQQTINLNKHQSEGLRFRNKLGFDLLKGHEKLMSLQTQFVHLYVKDETSGEDEFHDYGLYTQVEQLNKRGMKAHGLDSNGHLYKINFCEFYRYEDVIVPVDDPRYNQAAFDEILECKADNDHTKLIKLLEAVNDYTISPDDLIDEYLDMENLTYWMAFHILTGNIDTQNRNFYIYSPLNSQTWYILSWDLDAMLRQKEHELDGTARDGSWEIGISNYWGNMMFRRCLKSERFLEALDAAIEDLRGYLSPERIDSMARRYEGVVENYLWEMPDAQYAPLTKEEYELSISSLGSEVDINYQLYQESLKRPMPFYIDVPEARDGALHFNWEAAYDFGGGDITYEAKISANYTMENPLAEYSGVFNEFQAELLPPGQYFIQVTAINDAGYRQNAFDYYVTESAKNYGIKCFYVLEDGTIEEDVYVE